MKLFWKLVGITNTKDFFAYFKTITREYSDTMTDTTLFSHNDHVISIPHHMSDYHAKLLDQ